jgi:hypothetical protein
MPIRRADVWADGLPQWSKLKQNREAQCSTPASTMCLLHSGDEMKAGRTELSERCGAQ